MRYSIKLTSGLEGIVTTNKLSTEVIGKLVELKNENDHIILIAPIDSIDCIRLLSNEGEERKELDCLESIRKECREVAGESIEDKCGEEKEVPRHIIVLGLDN